MNEILHANYTFLNQPLAKHYGVTKEIKSVREPELVEGADEYNRGGLLRLGAVLTATSAPLRTSPVKRGDWVLRRILGTPTPPPPPDAGSLPADDKQFGGMTVFDRKNDRASGCVGDDDTWDSADPQDGVQPWHEQTGHEDDCERHRQRAPAGNRSHAGRRRVRRRARRLLPRMISPPMRNPRPRPSHCQVATPATRALAQSGRFSIQRIGIT